MSVKQYGNRNAIALDAMGGYYLRHLLAMTRECLDSKSAIALELAWRDAEIDRLKKAQPVKETATDQAVSEEADYGRTYCDCCSTRLGDGQTGLCGDCLPDSPKQFTRLWAEHRMRGGRLPHNVQGLAGLLAAYARAWDAYKEAKQ